MLLSLLLAAWAVSFTSATGNIPVSKVRGVNLGGLFVVEPWMMGNEWKRMGCSGQKSEFDCISNVASAQAGFTSHWDTWITQADLQKIASYGLNTIRVPVGYWIVEQTVDKASEHFPKGGFGYLKRLCGWAADAGLNVIIDLHGAPGAQQPTNPFTGQYATTAGFYNQYNYDRAYTFLSNMTYEIHQNTEFRSVFALEAVNEPLQSTSGVKDMSSNYYPGALGAVRQMENQLGISCASYSKHRFAKRSTKSTNKRDYTGCLNVQFMDKLWWSGEPSTSLPNTNNVIYDDHRYIKYVSTASTRADLMTFTCAPRTTEADNPVIVGEWALSVPGGNEFAAFSTSASDAATFYKQYAGAQMQSYEKGAGWIFWTWKTDGLNDPRWDYQLAVSRGFLPSTASAYDTSACDGY